MQDSKRDTDVKNRLLDSVGGEGGMIWENSIETWILSYVKQITSPGSMHETGGRGAKDGEHMHTHGWFMSMHGKTTTICKVISLQLK